LRPSGQRQVCSYGPLLLPSSFPTGNSRSTGTTCGCFASLRSIKRIYCGSWYILSKYVVCNTLVFANQWNDVSVCRWLSSLST
jgi:hypothetical protein